MPDEYVAALINEINFRLKKNLPDKLQTVYIGGGTPSLLGNENLLKICDAVKPFISDGVSYEWTIEANPDDVTESFLDVLQNSAVNRLSCGIQAFDDSILSLVNRRSSLECVKNALDLIRKKWKGQFSVDLISALPGQKTEMFLEGLKSVLAYGPDHVSLYSLTIEEGTPLKKSIDLGNIDYDFDGADQMWISGRDFLLENGYEQYEVSNFYNVHTGKKSEHNLTYWKSLDYVGCGSGATGTVRDFSGIECVKGFRWTNTQDIKEYVRFWNDFDGFTNEKIIPQEEEELDEETLAFEFFMMGLRVSKGVCIEYFEKRFCKRFPEKIEKLGLQWEKQGKAIFYEREGLHYFALTGKGLLFLNDFLRQII